MKTGSRFSASRLLGAMLALLALVATPLWAGDAQAQTRPLKKVRIAVGTTNLNLAYPWLMMPLALDYWKSRSR